MNVRINLIKAVLLGSAALLFGAAVATAQRVVWNPPCTSTTFQNQTGCTVELVLWTAYPPMGNMPIAVPPGTTVYPGPQPVPPSTTLAFDGLKSASNTPVSMMPQGPPAPAPGPATYAGWVRGVTTNPNGCCVDVYFDVATCTIWVFPGTPPCTP